MSDGGPRTSEVPPLLRCVDFKFVALLLAALRGSVVLSLDAVLPSELRQRLYTSAHANQQVAETRVLNVNFFPRESHLITFRDPWSFPMLFHPACNQLVRKHMNDLAQKVWFSQFQASSHQINY